MKGFIIIITAFWLATPALFALDQPRLARVTVYWASGGKGSDRYTRQHKTSTGLRLRTGHCAVDPRHVPYGSKVVFPDGTALAAVDTGTAVKNRKAARKSGRTSSERSAIVVDRFFETKRQALSWARTHPLFMPVKIVAPNSRGISPAPPALQMTAKNSLPSAAKPTKATAYALVANNAPVARNPLNKMGR
jgi:3D (Asp-Asp-Asp) domain-containing protein